LKLSRVLAQDRSDQRVRNENDARRHFLLALGITDSAQELYIQTHISRLTPSTTVWYDTNHCNANLSGNPTSCEQLLNDSEAASTPTGCDPGSLQGPNTSLVPTNRSSTATGLVPPIHVAAPFEHPFQILSCPAQPHSEAVFSDPRSSGLLEPLSVSPIEGLCLTNTHLTFGGYDVDGTTACPIAFSMILRNNARGYSIARLESKLLVGYQTAQIRGENCRILNKVLFSVLAEIS